ncbi:PREDICTED: uncharacterized protein LOC108360268 [Rhagoletis zephyria]|uniref:uncharacterized protein LOC108360268 n=1 Tax=Rhagoletis zephyria TaxID=28612 RepID=UPI0008112A3B|nr:PREDICTED: uncharacterized protein LOC108360268 [Rhagoletis zephyria]
MPNNSMKDGETASDGQSTSTGIPQRAPVGEQQISEPPQFPAEIFRVGIKPPVFCKEQPDLYFIQMESQFAVAKIMTDQTKYNHFISSLEVQYLIAAGDIVRNPPETGKYEAVKAALISEFTDSDQKKLRRLVKEIELGDLKPSQLLKRMKELASGRINDDVLKSLWIERLPDSIRSVITIVDGDSTQMALQADRMIEMQSFPGVSAVQSSTQSFAAEIDALRKEIAELKVRRPNHRRPCDRSRNRSQSKARFPFCRYHYRFGDKAKKCIEPCQFKKLSSTATEN